jgi:phasin family protein
MVDRKTAGGRAGARNPRQPRARWKDSVAAKPRRKRARPAAPADAAVEAAAVEAVETIAAAPAELAVAVAEATTAVAEEVQAVAVEELQPAVKAENEVQEAAPVVEPVVKSPAPKAPARRARSSRVSRSTTVSNGQDKRSDAPKEGTRTMTIKTEATKAADGFQNLFGDVNERAKSALERNSRIAEEFTELTKGNVEALVASSKIAAKGVETIGQEVADFSRKAFDETSAVLKRFSEVKSPTDFFRLQGEFARTQFDSYVARSSQLSETVIKLAGEVTEPLSSRYSVAAERVKAAVAL